jgi:glycosyltransferase involved in cell wall biosynthesis
LEVLIIDGCSTDDTLQLISEYPGLMIKVQSEHDDGIYDAINKGIRMANGNLIVVVGSDDTLTPHALDNIYHEWLISKPDIVAGRSLMISADGNETLREDEDYGLGALLSGIPFCHNAMFATREAYRKVGLYSLDYKICADAEWVHRAIKAKLTCSKIDFPTVRFSLSGASSVNPDKIMMETYKVIKSNFPSLESDDIKKIFAEIRGWGVDDNFDQLLLRYSNDFNFMLSACMAFHSKFKYKKNEKEILPSELKMKPRCFSLIDLFKMQKK